MYTFRLYYSVCTGSVEPGLKPMEPPGFGALRQKSNHHPEIFIGVPHIQFMSCNV